MTKLTGYRKLHDFHYVCRFCPGKPVTVHNKHLMWLHIKQNHDTECMTLRYKDGLEIKDVVVEEGDGSDKDVQS